MCEVDLLGQIDIKSKEIEALQNALQTTDLKLKTALADFSRKLSENRRLYEENLTELRNFKASRIADDKKKKKVEKKALRKERKAKFKALAKAMEKIGSNSTQPGDSEEPRISELFEVMVDENKNAIETDPKLKKQDNEMKTDVEKDIETNCTICAILINDYKPKYFLNIEKNPACDDCCDSTDDEDANYEHGKEKFEVKQEAQSEEHSNMVATKLQASKGDLERKNEEEIQKMKWNVRLKVKTKLEARLKNGEINRNMYDELEEELVAELEAEFFKDFEVELRRRTEVI